MKNIIDIINQSEKIAVLTHISEDADALGSASAFAELMGNVGKTTHIYVSEKPEARLSFMKSLYTIYDEWEKIPQYDLCVCLDCGDLGRLGKRIKIFQDTPHTVNIDHHFTNPQYAEFNLVRADASSTGEVLYSLFAEMGAEITKEIAEFLYIAIVSDSGCFKYHNTSPETLKTASKLMEKGFDHAEICRKLFDTDSKEMLEFKGYVMQNINEYFGGKLCICAIEEEIFEKYNVLEKDAGDIVNIPRSVAGCEIAVFVRKKGEMVKISFRSNGKYNVSEIAASFGGGGHKMAAGGTVKKSTVKNVEKMIVDFCKAVFERTND